MLCSPPVLCTVLVVHVRPGANGCACELLLLGRACAPCGCMLLGVLVALSCAHLFGMVLGALALLLLQGWLLNEPCCWPACCWLLS